MTPAFSLCHAHVAAHLQTHPDATIIDAMTPTQLRRWRTDVLKATQEVAAKQLGMSVKGYEKLEQGERRIAPWIEKLVRYITRFGVID